MTTQRLAIALRTTKRELRILRKLLVYFRLGPQYLLLVFAGRFHSVRSLMQWWARKRRPVELANTPAAAGGVLIADLEPCSAVQTLRRDGLLSGVRLHATALDSLRTTLLNQPCHGSGDPKLPFLYANKEEAERRYGKRFLQGHYYGLTKIPAVRQVAADAFLNSVVKGYFRAAPRLVGIRAWWTFACEATAQERHDAAQLFHYDVDDYLALSAFFYLTDVDAADGPHVAITGTHGGKSARHVWALSRCQSDEEIVKTYGAGRVRTICGRAGEGFIEDPFCFHKGQSPTGRDRLVLQLRYALHDYGTGRDSAHQEWCAADQA